MRHWTSVFSSLLSQPISRQHMADRSWHGQDGNTHNHRASPQHHLPVHSSSCKRLWLEWPEPHLWASQNARSACTSLIQNKTWLICRNLKNTTVAFANALTAALKGEVNMCVSLRCESYRSGSGPQAGAEGAGRGGRPAARACHANNSFHPSVLDGEWLFVHLCFIKERSVWGCFT